MQGLRMAVQKRRISSSVSGASRKTMSAPSASKSRQRSSASSKPLSESHRSWQKAYGLAKEKVRAHQLNVSTIQRDLNDVSGGVYTERRTTVVKMLGDEQAALASAQAELDRLDAEGRSNGWPRG